MIICVTGCGPTLLYDPIPKLHAFFIGVNLSYELIKPHIICTVDPRTLIVLEKVRKEPIYTLTSTNAPLEIINMKSSGAFAIWVASLFRPQYIYLAGFGGVGHFYPDPTIRPMTQKRIIERNNSSFKSIVEYIKYPIVQNGKILNK